MREGVRLCSVRRRLVFALKARSKRWGLKAKDSCVRVRSRDRRCCCMGSAILSLCRSERGALVKWVSNVEYVLW